MLLSNARRNSGGFTLIEMLVIVAIIGILSAIAAPSFLGLFSRNKVDNALNQVRGALQECQREAIRKSKSCTITLDITNKKVTSDLLVTGERDLCEKRDDFGNCIKSIVAIATNLSGTPPTITFSFRGTVILADAGKVVLSTLDDPNKKKCLVISAPLGIMRTGNYTGLNSTAAEITAGTCTTLQ